MTALVACALFFPPSRAAAGLNNLTVALHYEVEASTHGCWDEAKFRRGVAHRIGYDPFRDDAPLTVRVHVGGSTLAVDGQVEWRNASGEGMGERKFVAKDGNCSKLMTEMSFAVGLQIEFLRLKPPKAAPVNEDNVAALPTPNPRSGPAPDQEGPQLTTPTPPETPPPSTEEQSPPKAPANEVAAKPEEPDRPAPQPPPQKSEASPPQPSPRWAMWAGAGPSLAWRLSPGLTADGRVFLGLRRRSLSFEFGAEATYPSTFRRWDGSGFRHTLIGGTVAVCGHLDWFSACALGRASLVRITGLGVDLPRTPNGFVGQAGARLAATLQVAGPWSLAVHADGLGLLTPSTVRLNQAPVWDMPRLGGLVGVDVLARFR